MRFLLSILLTALLSFAIGLFLPWWTICFAALSVAALIPQRPLTSFFTGFISVFLLWFLLAWWISNNNGHALAHKVSMVIFKMDNPWLLMLATALIGGLVAGFAALAGSYLRRR